LNLRGVSIRPFRSFRMFMQKNLIFSAMEEL